MNLKILFMILIYYSVLSLVFIMGGSAFNEYTHNIELNNSELADTEIDKGGFFNSGISFSRYFGLITIGIGLPASTPQWFSIFFMFWQTIVTILVVTLIISAMWNG